MTFVVMVASLLCLTAGAEILVRGSTLVALRAGLSPLFVGLTIVGFGTSAPEMAASVVASLEGSSDVAVGNVVGSNIFNIAAILGLTALVAPIRIELVAVRRDLRVCMAAALVPFLALVSGGTLSFALGIGLLLALAAYLAGSYRAGRRDDSRDQERATTEVTSTLGIAVERRRVRDALLFNIVLVVVGLLLLVVGSRGFVLSAIRLASQAGIPELVIGLTIVSVGTSLPELVTSLVAARRGNPDLAVGNVLGSNVFNLLGILGVSCLVHPQQVAPAMLAVDVPVLCVLTLALFPILRTGDVISRREGLALLLGYAAYLLLQWGRAT